MENILLNQKCFFCRLKQNVHSVKTKIIGCTSYEDLFSCFPIEIFLLYYFYLSDLVVLSWSVINNYWQKSNTLLSTCLLLFPQYSLIVDQLGNLLIRSTKISYYCYRILMMNSKHVVCWFKFVVEFSNESYFGNTG